MTTKLTLTVEQDIIEKAKLYAKSKGQSLSGIIENYLKAIVVERADSDTIAPISKSLKGAFKANSKEDYKSQLSDRLAEKYL
ncbi:MAG: hypothetical protein KBG80_01105 [Breznakibacter sp.]|jgi:hypothetical protein|nr:hypothetical protein [Breznakibacter sp.]